MYVQTPNLKHSPALISIKQVAKSLRRVISVTGTKDSSQLIA